MGWRTVDIGDLGGLRVVITGANSGIGLAAARALAAHGAGVTLAVRDEGRGNEAASTVSTTATGRVEVALVDLADLASIARFASAWKADHPEGLDVLVNNAGIMAIPQQRTADGFEMQLGTNHLGHYALTAHLADALRPGGRVVTVSSSLHRTGRIRFGDLQSERSYRPWAAYGQSKLANLLFSLELDRRARAAEIDLRSIAVHPGYAATNLQGVGPRMAGDRLAGVAASLGNRLLAQSAGAGAWPTLRAVTDPKLTGGEFLGPGRLFNTRGLPTLQRPSRAARSKGSAARLWDVSGELTGAQFPW